MRPMSYARIRKLTPMSEERIERARERLLLSYDVSSRCAPGMREPGFESTEPRLRAAIEALPDLEPTHRLAPEVRRIVEDAIGLHEVG